MKSLLSIVTVLLLGCGSSHGRDAGPVESGPADTGAPTDTGVLVDTGGPTDGGTDWASCMTNPQCVVAPASCCGNCGVATPTDMVGVNQAHLSEQRAEACAAGDACPECALPEDPYLVATCSSGTCSALDLRAEGLTACTMDADCVLATSRCCDCSVHTEMTAIAVSMPGITRLNELTCDPGAPCPPCVPGFDGLEARCEMGSCVVRASM